MDTKINFLIIGGYSCGNFGDEIILRSLVQNISKTFEYPKIKILPFFSNKKFILHNLEEVFTAEPIQLFRAIDQSDVVIFGGGGVIQELSKRKSILRGVIKNLEIALMLDKKCILLGVGAGPINTQHAKKLTKFYLDRVNLITTRDKKSYDFLRDIGVKNKKLYITSDLSFCLDIPKNKIVTGTDINKNSKVGISIINLYRNKLLNKDEYDRFRDTFVDFCRWVIDECKVDLYLFPFQIGHEGDLVECEYLRERINSNKVVIVDTANLYNFLSSFNKMDYFVAMRYHSVLLSIIFKKPFMAISYHPKVISMMEENSLSQYLIRTDDSIIRYQKVFNLVIKNLEQFSNNLREILVQEKKKANSNFVYLANLIDKLKTTENKTSFFKYNFRCIYFFILIVEYYMHRLKKFLKRRFFEK